MKIIHAAATELNRALFIVFKDSLIRDGPKADGRPSRCRRKGPPPPHRQTHLQERV